MKPIGCEPFPTAKIDVGGGGGGEGKPNLHRCFAALFSPFLKKRRDWMEASPFQRGGKEDRASYLEKDSLIIYFPSRAGKMKGDMEARGKRRISC